MRKLVVALTITALLALGLLLALSSLAAQLAGPPPFDPVAYERQQQAIAQAEALAPLDVAMAAFWRVLPAVALAGGLLYLASLGVAHVARFRHERQPNSAGLLPVRAERLDDVAPAALASYHQARIEEARRPNVPLHLSSVYHAPHYRGDALGDALPALADAPIVSVLPGVTDLAALDFRPSRERILLGLAEGGEPITVPAKALCHVALVGATGGGKSNLLRLILPQLQAMGAQVVLADPHFAPIDPDTGEDWRPIAARLHMAPAVTTGERGQIAQVLRYLGGELQRRKDARGAGRSPGAPLFLALDELPVIADKVPGAVEQLGDLLREGRKFGLYVVGASQSMLIKVVGGDSSAREAYRTAFYVGGDLKSAVALLDMPQREIDEGALATGVAYLRSSATSPARLVRVPYASNEGISGLLGATSDATSGATSEGRRIGFRVPRREVGAEVGAEAHSGEPLPAHQDAQKWTPEERRIVALLAEGKKPREIVIAVFGVEGGREYQRGAAIVAAVLARLARGATL